MILIRPLLIIVTGIPCTGKTILANKLKHIFNFELVSKDEIKEKLFDEVGFNSLEEKNELNNISFKLLLENSKKLIFEKKSFIVENDFFSVEKDQFELIIDDSYDVVTILLDGKSEIIYNELLKRDQNPNSGRHKGHISYKKYPVDEGFVYRVPFTLVEFKKMIRDSKIRKFSIGYTIKIDVSDNYDINVDNLVKKINIYANIDYNKLSVKKIDKSYNKFNNLLKIQNEAFSKYDIINFDYNNLTIPYNLFFEKNYELLELKYQNRSIGFCSIIPRGNLVYEIHRICIVNEFQNKKVGQFFLQSVEKIYNTAEIFILVTPEEIKRNVYFYLKNGYKIVKKFKDESQINMILLEKKVVK